MNENIISEVDVDTSGYIKREQMYVKRQFQQSLLLQSTLFTFIIVNVIVMAIYWAMDTIADLQQLKFYVAYTVVSLEIVGFIVLYKLNLSASHRIAGPIFSIERCLENIEKGNLAATLKLRKTDQFPESAEQLNTTVRTLRKKINNAQYLADQLQQNPDQLEELSQKLVDELAYFNTTDFDES